MKISLKLANGALLEFEGNAAEFERVSEFLAELKLANGALLEFEGNAAEFERVSEFLAEPPDSLAATPPEGAQITPPKPLEDRSKDESEPGAEIKPGAAMARLDQVEPRNDQERVGRVRLGGKNGPAATLKGSLVGAGKGAGRSVPRPTVRHQR